MGFAVISATDQAAWAGKSLVDSSITERGADIVLNGTIGTSVSVAGLEDAQQQGDVRTIYNRGTIDVILAAEDTNAPANNRFLSTVTIPPGSKAQLFFNGTRWEPYIDVTDSRAIGRALRFNASKFHHVDHGALYTAANTYGIFAWDALVRPTGANTAGYVISAGYGGAHNLLWGFDADATHAGITGNIWMDGVLTSFSTPNVIPLGSWVHVMIKWDLAAIIVWVNGIAVSYTPAVGTLRTATNGPDSVLFVGGSDHSNYSFDLAWIRGFENTVPAFGVELAALKIPRFPLTTFNESGLTINAVFAADYTQPCGIIADVSSGLNGARHAGYRGQGINVGTFVNTGQNFTSSIEADLPQWVSANIVKYVPPTSVTVPPTARIYDSFTTRDWTPFWDNTTSLGNTEGGILGTKTWTNGNYYYILYGQVVAATRFPLSAFVDNESTDTDLRIEWTGQGDFYSNYLDANNFLLARMSSGSLYFESRVAGVVTVLFDASVGVTSGTMRITKTGTAVQIFINGGSVASATVAGLTGTNIGFNLTSYGVDRLSKIETY